MSDVSPRFSAVPTGDDVEPGIELDDERAESFGAAPEPAPMSPLEALRQEAQKEAQRDACTLDVPGRPGWKVRFRSDVTIDKLNRWSKVCKNRSMPDGYDAAKLQRITLANQCEAILFNGQQVVDTEGKPVTFRDKQFLELTGKTNHTEAIFWWYGSDGIITVINGKILSASGFDEDAVREGADADDLEGLEDPTQP